MDSFAILVESDFNEILWNDRLRILLRTDSSIFSSTDFFNGIFTLPRYLLIHLRKPSLTRYFPCTIQQSKQAMQTLDAETTNEPSTYIAK